MVYEVSESLENEATFKPYIYNSRSKICDTLRTHVTVSQYKFACKGPSKHGTIKHPELKQYKNKGIAGADLEAK